ncbi:DNA-binding transcriptional response regulator, NtrC family, contains REC, AAA-type ATPase, and a Fis-type DNA-binding domains [Devosia enhydra]|uniref:DNA-binding transcriptional regulator NtrC n=1 Tax=Devosia enhydra TaxID=665118 RepID=A0A1K2HX11_9HYPH|nr:sigma-54 dependent transcriptional regulator [Devosia enhydra]SFZ83678.1 DNA-binding transcriptional response regulator, NtrC family, contains REC, AAA-type ATPase, and a Fis-type DNA-binding domains [Devosia enhydra]
MTQNGTGDSPGPIPTIHDPLQQSSMARILVVDDDHAQRLHLSALVAALGHEAIPAQGGDEALALIAQDGDLALMLLDLVMPERDGMAVLDALSRHGASLPVIVLSGHPSRDVIATARQRGAIDYLAKPVVPERLEMSIDTALAHAALRRQLEAERHRSGGECDLSRVESVDPAMRRVIAQLGKAARSGLPVLLEGEAGTGKSLVARALHGQSDRAGRQCLALSLTTIAPERMEDALFGSTAAGSDARGLLRAAHGGTLIIEDIARLPLAAQARLATYLATGNAAPAGQRPDRPNTRIIATTRRRLLNLARLGTLREDLYNRLNLMPVYLPPLRQRPGDILALAETAARRIGAEEGRILRGLTADAEALLMAHDWPGNVAELLRHVARAVAISEGERLRPADFPALLRLLRGPAAAAQHLSEAARPSAPVHIDAAILSSIETAEISATGTAPAMSDRFIGADGTLASLAQIERELIVFALERHAGHMSKVARTLGIGRSTLYRKLRDYGIDGGWAADAA